VEGVEGGRCNSLCYGEGSLRKKASRSCRNLRRRGRAISTDWEGGGLCNCAVCLIIRDVQCAWR
jgi:hypothetical protein